MRPPLFGAFAQAFDGYATILTISIGLLVVSIAQFLALGKYPQAVAADLSKDRLEQLAGSRTQCWGQFGPLFRMYATRLSVFWAQYLRRQAG